MLLVIEVLHPSFGLVNVLGKDFDLLFREFEHLDVLFIKEDEQPGWKFGKLGSLIVESAHDGEYFFFHLHVLREAKKVDEGREDIEVDDLIDIYGIIFTILRLRLELLIGLVHFGASL